MNTRHIVTPLNTPATGSFNGLHRESNFLAMPPDTSTLGATNSAGAISALTMAVNKANPRLLMKLACERVMELWQVSDSNRVSQKPQQ